MDTELLLNMQLIFTQMFVLVEILKLGDHTVNFSQFGSEEQEHVVSM